MCFYDASSAGAPAGTPCQFLNECNPGLTCAYDWKVPGCQGSYCCSPFCDLSDPNADVTCDAAFDTPGAICVAVFDDPKLAPEGLANVGVCATPP